MSKKFLSFLLLTGFFVTIFFSKSLYLVDGNKAMRLGKVFLWSQPYVKLSDVSIALNLKWSYKGRSGVVTNGKDFISFNTSTHNGLYDALYKLQNVATGTDVPYISLKSMLKLTNLKVEDDPVGYFLVKKAPSLTINGVLLYGKNFTVFFAKKPTGDIMKIERSGMVSTVTIFPVLISKDYVPSHSPLVVEERGKYSVSFRITFTSNLSISYALGYPSLPLQKSKNVELPNGITYQSLEYASLRKNAIKMGIVKIPPSSGILKLVHPLEGIGKKELITSMISATALAAIGFSNSNNEFIKEGKNIFSYSALQNGPILVWNDRKFDIIETSPTISVNIGNVPFSVDEINGSSGNAILYTDDYALQIPRDTKDRIYFEVENGRIVGMKYAPHVSKNSYILSLTKDYAIFLKNVHLGDDFYLFFSLGLNSAEKWKGFIQGKCLLVADAKKEELWPNEIKSCEGKNALVMALKNGNLYLVKMESPKIMSTSEMADVMVNMGFSKAMLLSNSSEISMIVNGKAVEFDNRGLYPVGFGVEIDKTTGGA